MGWSDQQPFVAALGVLLVAASLGFLGHNWPPARILQCVASLWDGCGRRRRHACPEFIEGIVRELQNNPHLGLAPVGFLDDNLGKHEVTR